MLARSVALVSASNDINRSGGGNHAEAPEEHHLLLALLAEQYAID
jgi:hypothetical protein